MRLHLFLIAGGTLLLLPGLAMGQSAATHAPEASHSAVATPSSPAPAVAPQATSHADAIMAEVQSLPPNDEQALQMLMDGNYRFVDGLSKHPRADASRLIQTATDGQKPFATILTCSDSRVPPELIFDQGVGDLFIIRVAGNVISPDETGSIEYGVGHLHTPLLVVMGHTSCGAVTAAAQHAHVEGEVAQLLDRIQPAVANAQKQDPTLAGPALVSAAIRENVWYSIETLLSNSDEIRELVNQGKLRVVGATYDIRTGNVRWLGRHPRQEQILAKGHSAVSGEGDSKAAPKPLTEPAHATPPSSHTPASGTPSHESAPLNTPRKSTAPDTHGGHSQADPSQHDASSVNHDSQAAPSAGGPGLAAKNGHASTPAGHAPQVANAHAVPSHDAHEPAGAAVHATHTADEILAEATTGEGGPELAERLKQKFAAEAAYNARNSHNLIYVSLFMGIAGICSAFVIHRMERNA